jgi:hypothetical protein
VIKRLDGREQLVELLLEVWARQVTHVPRNVALGVLLLQGCDALLHARGIGRCDAHPGALGKSSVCDGVADTRGAADD